MATKTTVNEKGVFSERGANSDRFVLDAGTRLHKTPVHFASGSGLTSGSNVDITAPVTVFQLSGLVGVTGTLPGVGSDIYGQEHIIINISGSMMVSASNPINDSVWTQTLTARAAAYLAHSGSSGNGWTQLY